MSRREREGGGRQEDSVADGQPDGDPRVRFSRGGEKKAGSNGEPLLPLSRPLLRRSISIHGLPGSLSPKGMRCVLLLIDERLRARRKVNGCRLQSAASSARVPRLVIVLLQVSTNLNPVRRDPRYVQVDTYGLLYVVCRGQRSDHQASQHRPFLHPFHLPFLLSPFPFPLSRAPVPLAFRICPLPPSRL